MLENYSKILITMSPIIPHFANECLEILGNKDNSKWPISIKELLVENSVLCNSNKWEKKSGYKFN